MKKIIDSVLLEMAEHGDQQKDIASHFGVSEAAISKRLKQLRKQSAHHAVMDKLTAKEQRFVAEICAGTSQTQSAISAFDVGSIDSAKSIGNRLMKDSDIQLAINTIMEQQGLSRTHLIKSLRRHVDGEDAQVSLRATTEALKLHDAYPATRTQNLNLNRDITDADISQWFNRRPD